MKISASAGLENEDQLEPKFLANGTYGCAYYPSLPSRDITYQERIKNVSKMMKKSEAISELESVIVFRFLDPAGQYGLYANRFVNHHH